MDEAHLVPERGVLTASSAAWDLAVRRAEVVGRLAELDEVGHRCADAAAAELGLSRRQVYVLLRRWRQGEGVVSDMLPGQSSGGRGREHLPEAVESVIREVLRTRYLTRQRRSMSAVHREVARLCRSRGLPVPSRGALVRRAEKLDPVATTLAREGVDAARPLRSAGGVPPQVAELLEQVQIDHTVIDVIVVDERHRLPIGRPYITVAIDVLSRAIVGLVVTLEAPSALSVGLCLAHMVTDKRAWLERIGVDVAWPMSGKPAELYLDNAAEFKSEALRRGCEQHGVTLRWRPPGQPHYGRSPKSAEVADGSATRSFVFPTAEPYAMGAGSSRGTPACRAARPPSQPCAPTRGHTATAATTSSFDHCASADDAARWARSDAMPTMGNPTSVTAATEGRSGRARDAGACGPAPAPPPTSRFATPATPATNAHAPDAPAAGGTCRSRPTGRSAQSARVAARRSFDLQPPAPAATRPTR